MKWACEKFFLFLYGTEFEIRTDHKPLITVLSRLPVGPAQSNDSAATKVYACSVVSEAVPSALTAKEVELASERDPTLKLIRDAVTSGDWKHLSATMYKAISDEIWVLGQIVMRGHRIIIPESPGNRRCHWHTRDIRALSV